MLKPHSRSGPSFAGLRIGLLGGSFNPAHEGHRAISLFALKRLELDQVWWLVSPQNPLKSTKGMAPLGSRVKQAQKMANHYRIAVTDIERQFGTRYTIDTLRALRRRYPNARFVWLMGADNMKQMPAWKQWAEIFRLVPVAVFRRPAYAGGRLTGKAAQRFDKFWRAALYAKNLSGHESHAWIMLDNQLNTMSATEIRARED